MSLRKYCWSKKMNTIIVLKFFKLSSKKTLISVPAHTWVLRSPVTKASSQIFHGNWTRSWRNVPSLRSFVWILWSSHLPEKTFQSIGLLKIKIPGRNFSMSRYTTGHSPQRSSSSSYSLAKASNPVESSQLQYVWRLPSQRLWTHSGSSVTFKKSLTQARWSANFQAAKPRTEYLGREPKPWVPLCDVQSSWQENSWWGLQPITYEMTADCLCVTSFFFE